MKRLLWSHIFQLLVYSCHIWLFRDNFSMLKYEIVEDLSKVIFYPITLSYTRTSYFDILRNLKLFQVVIVKFVSISLILRCSIRKGKNCFWGFNFLLSGLAPFTYGKYRILRTLKLKIINWKSEIPFSLILLSNMTLYFQKHWLQSFQ